MRIDSADKKAVAYHTTWASIAVNALLSVAQLIVGAVAQSQALLADGAHSLTDLFSDFIVLFVNRHSSSQADADHHYGHSRYETVASLFLGGLLIAVSIGMLWRVGVRLMWPKAMPPVHPSALVAACVVLIVKEALFRYMLREATRVRSAMLIANAWHARSDAASSLVVAFGILGSLAGITLLDPIAALIVSFMIGKMGGSFAWNALQDLSDRALDQTVTSQFYKLLASTPGVVDVHELRTRKTGDFALIDAHILVDPRISVSEGHAIAEAARRRLLTDARVLDALIHVDPENDSGQPFPPDLPTRAELVAQLQQALAPYAQPLSGSTMLETVNIHYLRSGIELDIVLAPNADPAGKINARNLSRALGVPIVRLASRRAASTDTAALSQGGE